ncbi:MAG TPA: mannose-1-phosphate guanylyltransferase/mannose-6-phosphate isomerase [Negativicutes bacterium]|nr:mannose-1-phosphate guanylyltransferase/mannose-6-phosphate isomerase [Negativicutes bacterium]
MKVVILAGGGGTRLFPLSRRSMPKQFLKIEGEESLLIGTVKRFQGLVTPQDILIVTNEQYYHQVASELRKANIQGVHILLEPAARNTAPAIALAVKYCLEELQCSPDEVLFVSPADHLINPADKFLRYVAASLPLVEQGRLVVFGITPDKPETGFGYIQAGQPCDAAKTVLQFKEKPDSETAQQYVAAGNYYWNAGMFAFSLETIMEEFAAHAPEIQAQLSTSYAELLHSFAVLPNISIDYAVAEKSRQLLVLPMNLQWNDIGSWDALYEVMSKDANGNVKAGDCTLLDCRNSMFLGRDRLIAGVGVEDIIVVETNDVIVVAQKGETQKIKDLVGILRAQNRREAEEHTTIYRPWGSYTVLGEGPGYKMKLIAVEPTQTLSLQMHYHRSEHWIVTKGTAKVTIGEKEQMVHENESVFVPKSTKHRLENPGRITLEIIEVQNGNYLEEDDIVRFEDQYGRIKK